VYFPFSFVFFPCVGKQYCHLFFSCTRAASALDGRPFFGRSTLLSLVNPCLLVRPFVSRPRSTLDWSTSFDPSLVDVVRPFLGRPRSTLVWLVDHPLLVRPCFRWSTLVCSFDPSSNQRRVNQPKHGQTCKVGRTTKGGATEQRRVHQLR
jgi:hypothetical protein